MCIGRSREPADHTEYLVSSWLSRITLESNPTPGNCVRRSLAGVFKHGVYKRGPSVNGELPGQPIDNVGIPRQSGSYPRIFNTRLTP